MTPEEREIAEYMSRICSNRDSVFSYRAVCQYIILSPQVERIRRQCGNVRTIAELIILQQYNDLLEYGMY